MGVRFGGRYDRPALYIVFRWIHGDKHGRLEIELWFPDADRRYRRKLVVMGIDVDDVLELGNAPVGPELTAFYQVHGVFLPQPLEIVPV